MNKDEIEQLPRPPSCQVKASEGRVWLNELGASHARSRWLLLGTKSFLAQQFQQFIRPPERGWGGGSPTSSTIHSFSGTASSLRSQRTSQVFMAGACPQSSPRCTVLDNPSRTFQRGRNQLLC